MLIVRSPSFSLNQTRVVALHELRVLPHAACHIAQERHGAGTEASSQHRTHRGTSNAPMTDSVSRSTLVVRTAVVSTAEHPHGEMLGSSPACLSADVQHVEVAVRSNTAWWCASRGHAECKPAR
jgi:hypothetical protein